jgi:hypothetical protein
MFKTFEWLAPVTRAGMRAAGGLAAGPGLIYLGVKE